MTRSTSFNRRVTECRQAVTAYFATLRECFGGESFQRSVSWVRENDPKELKWQINLLAEFASRARSKIAVWEPHGGKLDGKVEFSQPLIEGPERLVSILYSLACGHSIVNGRTQLTPEDLPLIIDVALSSMPDDRRQIVQLLLQESSDLKEMDAGTVSSSDIERSLTISKPTALKLIEELDRLEIGEKVKGDSRYPDTLKLRSCYDWLLSQEFASYRQSTGLLTWEQGFGC